MSRRAIFFALILLLVFFVTPDAHSDVLSGVQQEFYAGDYASAMGILRALLSQDPNNAAQHYWLGRCYYEVRNYHNAVSELQKATRLDPNSAADHDWLGRAVGAVADQERSLLMALRVRREFEAAVRANPADVTARRDLEEYLLDAPWIIGGSKDGALQQAAAVAKINPVQGHLAKAEYESAIGQSALAAEEYQAALSSKPNAIDPYLEVADYYARLSDGAKLTAVLREARAANPQDPRLLFYSGMAHVITGSDFTLAEENLKAYLASSPARSDWPSHSSARFWLGQLYERQGDKMAAAEQYRDALGLDPKNGHAKQALEHIEKSLH